MMGIEIDEAELERLRQSAAREQQLADQLTQARINEARARALREHPRVPEAVLNRVTGSPEDILAFAQTFEESVPAPESQPAQTPPPSPAGEPVSQLPAGSPQPANPVPVPGPGSVGPAHSQADEIQAQIDDLMGTRRGSDPLPMGSQEKFGGPLGRFDIGNRGENARALYDQAIKKDLGAHLKTWNARG